MRTQVLLLSLFAAACGSPTPDPFAPEVDAGADDRRTLEGAYDRTNLLRARIDALQKELEAVSAELADVSSEVEIHGVDVKNLQSAVSSISSTVDGHVTVLKGMDTDIDALDGHVTVLKAAATDSSGGACAYTRDHASGLATGRRQHLPLLITPTTHVWGDPHVDQRDPVVSSSDVSLVSVDADLDGKVDYVAIEADLDGDGFSDLIELGGDRDSDGDLTDDALDQSKRDDAAADLICGSTDHF